MRPPIKPGGKHDEFEKLVSKKLEMMGFKMAKAGYHDVYSEDIVNLLRSRFSFTALYIRMRADRIAIHANLPIEFELEIKTNAGPHANMAIEAFPIAIHRLLEQYGVRCLYIYCDFVRNLEKGFWVEEMPMPSKIYIPDRWNNKKIQQFREFFTYVFPDIPIKLTKRKYGSGDPFLIIQEEKIYNLPNWETVIARLLQDTVF